ncbi:MAG: hypothetical protein AAF555_10385, partial [Verrucomicrobiota bacterium]
SGLKFGTQVPSLSFAHRSVLFRCESTHSEQLQFFNYFLAPVYGSTSLEKVYFSCGFLRSKHHRVEHPPKITLPNLGSELVAAVALFKTERRR